MHTFLYIYRSVKLLQLLIVVKQVYMILIQLYFFTHQLIHLIILRMKVRCGHRIFYEILFLTFCATRGVKINYLI